MSGTFGESSRASFPRKQIVGQGSRSVFEVIFALTKSPPPPQDFGCLLMQEGGGQGKISRRSWLLDKNGKKFKGNGMGPLLVLVSF